MKIKSLLIVLLFATLGFSQTDISTKADEYLSAYARTGRFSGSVLIAKDGRILLRKGYGAASYELDVPNTPETVFRIGSITKSFTALCILQLEEQKKLNVADQVAKYIPEIPEAWQAITIHQLLTHTSGIPDYAADAAYGKFDDPQRVEAALRNSADKPLLNPPGASFRYSNAGYILLGRIIEKVSGLKYEDYVVRNILVPAGMSHSGYDHNQKLLKNRAHGYLFRGEHVVNAKNEDMEWAHSAGALYSTVDDLYQFDRSLASGKLFSSSLTAKAWTAYTHFNAPPPFNFDADYGYGWMLGKDFGHAYLGHGGWVAGFVSQFNRYPQDDAVIILLTNIESTTPQAIMHDLAAILFGAEYHLPAVRQAVHPDRKTLEPYIGKYQAGPLEIKVWMEDGELFVFGTGQRVPFGMIAFSDREFFFNDVDSEMRFEPDPDGKVNRCVVHFAGRDIPMNRVPD
jgi:CubicO group peptidase (beta-lactamase class C family)